MGQYSDSILNKTQQLFAIYLQLETMRAANVALLVNIISKSIVWIRKSKQRNRSNRIRRYLQVT